MPASGSTQPQRGSSRLSSKILGQQRWDFLHGAGGGVGGGEEEIRRRNLKGGVAITGAGLDWSEGLRKRHSTEGRREERPLQGTR